MSATTENEISELNAAAVEAAISEHLGRPGALLPILQEVQHRIGHIPPAAVPIIAHALNLSRAEVHGVISFYHDFRDHPAGRTVIRVCQAESCQACGATDLGAAFKKRLGVDWHQTTSDGAYTLEPVYCLGQCALSPAIMVNDQLLGRVSPERVDLIVAQPASQP